MNFSSTHFTLKLQHMFSLSCPENDTAAIEAGQL